MYSRDTELRHLHAKDIYQLCVILDDNGCWKKLMAIIPKDITTLTVNAQGDNLGPNAATPGFKYNNDHINLIESAVKRSHGSSLYSQTLFDEWGTSGRKHERPTIGILLQLLTRAELFRAADYVASEFLNEPLPERPQNGPAARIDISLTDDIFDDIQQVVNDSEFYPGTEALNYNVNSAINATDNNVDYYSKYQRTDKTVLPENTPPKPPPRASKLAKLQQRRMLTEATTAEAGNRSSTNQSPHQESLSTESIALTTPNIPKFSALLTKTKETNLCTLNQSDMHSSNTESTNLSEAPMPLLTILGHNASTLNIEDTTNYRTDNDILPIISALNLNGEKYAADEDGVTERSNLFQIRNSSDCNGSPLNDNTGDDNAPLVDSNLFNDIDDEDGNDADDDDDDYDGDDDDDDDGNNLGMFEQRSSNNDSSLTTVTGTSGDNSFELSFNDGSSASNENIPDLSALK